MFSYMCPSCGASAYSAAGATNVGPCPRCSQPLVQNDDVAAPVPACGTSR